MAKNNNAVTMVTVKLPLTKDQQDDVYVAVNGKGYQIKRGVAVQVPDYIAEVLERSEEMDQVAMMKQAAMMKH